MARASAALCAVAVAETAPSEVWVPANAASARVSATVIASAPAIPVLPPDAPEVASAAARLIASVSV
ncbi:hypothetical protein OG2516_18450 [Oceanicola granulosus HTCC2516]|uniref:Uncharacterized protein n=1 Tax=Oceanicola granulosus (strain ATCC BAA-861 / DSM 15982 / KCTC 12143 / HTCC2516) TaxID=314256 RepID=Q2CHG6_OCEGH|nr:hypothetical protein OG2516_18450 [Oceanicola granulosus HTCC2516]